MMRDEQGPRMEALLQIEGLRVAFAGVPTLRGINLTLARGHIVEELPADRLLNQPAHPYTKGLLAALPSLDGPRQRLFAIPRVVPNAAAFPPGCPFAPRCDRRIGRCREWAIELASLDGDIRHRAACLHVTSERPAGEVVAA